MVQNIPTQEEALLIYLQNQIRMTNGYIKGVTETLTRLEKDYEEVQSREPRFELARLIDDERLLLDNYQFRLDFLQTMLENAQNDFEQTLNFK